MKKYRHPRLNELKELQPGSTVGKYLESFLTAVDGYLQLFPPTMMVYPFYGGIQVEYEFDNAGHDYIEICFFIDGNIELFHSYENPDMDVEYQEEFKSRDVEEVAETFQKYISKINIYS